MNKKQIKALGKLNFRTNSFVEKIEFIKGRILMQISLQFNNMQTTYVYVFYWGADKWEYLYSPTLEEFNKERSIYTGTFCS